MKIIVLLGGEVSTTWGTVVKSHSIGRLRIAALNEAVQPDRPEFGKILQFYFWGWHKWVLSLSQNMRYSKSEARCSEIVAILSKTQNQTKQSKYSCHCIQNQGAGWTVFLPHLLMFCDFPFQMDWNLKPWAKINPVFLSLLCSGICSQQEKRNWDKLFFRLPFRPQWQPSARTFQPPHVHYDKVWRLGAY